MSFFSDLQMQLDTLRELVGESVDAVALPVAVDGLGDEQLVAVVERVSALARGCESLRIAASGVVAARSTRDAGHGGLAQRRGHRSPVSLIQDLTGSTRADAVRNVRLGEALSASHGAVAVPDASDVEDDTGRPWHAALGDALLDGTLSSAQHDAILRGLGEPAPNDAEDAEAGAEAAEVWSLAVVDLIAEARERTVEELARAARTVRDLLDPDGAQRRFDARFDGRSFRRWTDADGLQRASIVFDDEMGSWFDTVVDSALRPRRGGPRFVDPDEKARAADLETDPRTNTQLEYDLIMDVFRAGVLADAETVFGTRQAGVRVVVTADALAKVTVGQPAVGLTENGQIAVPAWLIQQRACDSGTIECTVDRHGNPLDLGREQRLFSSRQRVLLAIRDGGCRWRGCDRPASYCEAHHIDPYAQGGRTDVDRGILLCRFHHMNLHHGGWRITRDGRGAFLLHPPDGSPPIEMKPRLVSRYASGGVDPPARRFRPTG